MKAQFLNEKPSVTAGLNHSNYNTYTLTEGLHYQNRNNPGCTNVYNSVDILSSIETHEVHGKHLKLVCPVLELLNIFLQIQPVKE